MFPHMCSRCDDEMDGCQPAHLICRASECSSNDKNVATPWVAVLLSKVAAGHECVMRHDNTTLTTPPQGYDSVSVSGLTPAPKTESHVWIPSR